MRLDQRFAAEPDPHRVAILGALLVLGPEQLARASGRQVLFVPFGPQIDEGLLGLDVALLQQREPALGLGAHVATFPRLPVLNSSIGGSASRVA